ncbi:MAG: DUF4202 domain-containing protein [Gammaproteobacteria bacterium]|nr:DUF4202 domain-containing protein [Gammaproteobacteria bacterium]
MQDARFRTAIERMDAFNRADPNREAVAGENYPKELLYAERMTAQLARLAPVASEALQLAVRSQHIGRWTLPRSNYPMDRRGYHQWRTELARFHARTARDILLEVGYDEVTITRVESLLKKANLKTDPEAQLLEDTACLVFLEHYFSAFAQKHDQQKLIEIVQKTWKKMSSQAQQAALTLEFADADRAVIENALSAG